MNKKEKLAQDKLEKFILENQEEIKNQFTFRGNLWDKIEQELSQEASSENKHFWVVDKKQQAPKQITMRRSTLQRFAAVGLLLIGLAWAFGKWQGQNTGSASTQETYLDLSQINPELAETENYYTRLIAQKREELQKYPLKELGLEQEFQQDIKELNQLYEQLKSDLKEVPSQNQIVDAMIQNLQTRIKVLNRQLEILEKLKSQTKENEKKDEKQTAI